MFCTLPGIVRPLVFCAALAWLLGGQCADAQNAVQIASLTAESNEVHLSEADALIKHIAHDDCGTQNKNDVCNKLVDWLAQDDAYRELFAHLRQSTTSSRRAAAQELLAAIALTDKNPYRRIVATRTIDRSFLDELGQKSQDTDVLTTVAERLPLRKAATLSHGNLYITKIDNCSKLCFFSRDQQFLPGKHKITFIPSAGETTQAATQDVYFQAGCSYEAKLRTQFEQGTTMMPGIQTNQYQWWVEIVTARFPRCQ